MTDRTVVEIHISRSHPAPISVVAPAPLEQVADIVAEACAQRWPGSKSAIAAAIVGDLAGSWRGVELATSNVRWDSDVLRVDFISGVVADPTFRKPHSFRRWMRKRGVL